MSEKPSRYSVTSEKGSIGSKKQSGESVKSIERDRAAPSRAAFRTSSLHTSSHRAIRRGRLYCRAFVTKDIAEFYGRKEFLRVTVRDFLIYLLFMLNLYARSTYYKKSENHLLHLNFKHKFITQKFYSNNLRRMTSFEELNTVQEIWDYLNAVALRRLYDTDIYDTGSNKVRAASTNEKAIMYQNRMIGVPRIRQQLSHNQSCKIHHQFKKRFTDCYWDLDKEKMKNKEPFSDLNYEYQNSTDSPPYYGIAAVYTDGGYIDYFDSVKTTTINKLKVLRMYGYFRQATRFVIINFSYYNANFDTICICALMFELPRIGGVWTKFYHASIYFYYEMSWFTLFDYTFKFVNMAFIIYYMFIIFLEMWFFKVQYFLRFASYVDVVQMVAGMFGIVYQLLFFMQAHTILTLKEGSEAHIGEYVNLEWVMYYYRQYRQWLGIFLFMSYIRVFRFIGVNKTMNQLKNTLKKSTPDLVSFSVMFVVIFVAFGEVSYLLFGTDVHDFRKFEISLFSLTRTIFGDFNYTPLSLSKEVLAPIFFVFYIFFIFFVLLNMFMAIITESFIDVKTETAIAPDELEMSRYIIDKFLQCLVCLRLKKRKEREGHEFKGQLVKELLADVGFGPQAIDRFMMRFRSINNPEMFDLARMQAEVGERNRVFKDIDLHPETIVADDYMEFQERVESVETSIETAAEQLHVLIRRLDQLQNVQKRPRLM